MGIGKRDLQKVALELGKIPDKYDSKVIAEFLNGVLPQLNVNFDEAKFMEVVDREYILNYGNPRTEQY